MSDLVLRCTGGTPTPVGEAIPLENVQISVNTNITSAIVGASNVSEALLLIDEPFPGFNAVPPSATPTSGQTVGQLACLASNDTNCAITSVGPGVGSAGSYNGSAGHHNVFQGTQTSSNTITWFGVPIDGPGPSGTRIIRITNIRGNASQLAVSSSLLPTEIFEILGVNGSEAISILQPSGGNVVADLELGFSSAVPTPGAYTQCATPSSAISVTASEGFATAFKPQNYGQVLSAAGGIYAGPASGGTADQNVTGFQYNTESGLRLDPALGTGTFLDPAGSVGLATQGTQIQLTVAGIAAGVSLSVPSYVYLSGGYGDGTPLGVAVLVGQSAPAAVLAPAVGEPGPNVPLTIAGTTATAIYEIFYADPSVVETLTVPISVSYSSFEGPAPAQGTTTVTVSLSPLSNNASASSTDPVSRFVQPESPVTLFTLTGCTESSPTLTSISPTSGTAGTVVPVTLTGSNFMSGVTTVSVNNPGVSVSNATIENASQITATFNIALTTTPGAVNVTIVNNYGGAASVSGAVPFTVVAPTPTLTSISPTSGLTGTTVPITLSGTNFVPGATVNVSNSGVTASNVNVVSPTQITATFVIGASVATGAASVTVTTSGGTSGAVSFAINLSVPTLTSINPNSGTTGSSVPVILTGTNFVAGATVAVSNTGVTVSNVNVVSATQMTATFLIAANAAPGPANVTVTAAAGASGAVSFTIISNLVPTISSLSPASATSGGAAFTLTVSGFGFVDCAGTSCLGITWQPASGSSTFLSGQANSNGTQLTANVPAALIAAAGTASVVVQAAGGTSNSVPFIIAATTTSGEPISAGHLLFPNAGLNALQEFDPVKRVVVNTISLPAPFTYSSSGVIETVRIRPSDGGILTNATANENSTVVALTKSGQFVAGEQLASGSAQELAFDPLDSTQSTVLAGNPPGPNIIAGNPYSSAQSTRISQQGASYTGLAIDAVSRVYAGNSATGQIFRYLPDGSQGSLFADVTQATGSSEIDALAIDSDSNVYVAQSNSNRIAAFNSGGTFLNFLTDPGFNQITSTYFNASDGLLYAGNQADDALTILTTTGTPVAVVHLGGNNIGVPDLVPGAPAVVQGSMETTLSGLTFQTPQGGSAPPAQSIELVNNTSAALSFTTKVTTTSGGSWLSVSVGSSSAVAAGQVSAPIMVSVNPSGLAPSDYYGLIEIDAAGVPNSPQFVQVVLNILPPTVNPGASVSPTGMIFTAVVNGANPAEQTIAVSDVLSRATSFNVTGAASTTPSWFTFSPSQGTVQPGQTVNVQVQPTSTNLQAGVYSGTLTLQFPQDHVTRQVALVLVVASSATEIGQARFAPRQATIPCVPTELLMVFTELGNGFTQPASWSSTLETLVVDDCGTPMVQEGSVTVSFSGGIAEAPVNLVSQQQGNWSASWSPPNVAAPSLAVTANAVDSRGLKGSTQVSGSVQANPDIPVLTPSAVVSAASYSPVASPSSGELVAIFGTNLADGEEQAAQLPLSTQMQNAFVLLGGQTIPLLYVSPTQINAVVPYGLAGGMAQQAVARHGSRLSVPSRIAVAAAEPAVFTTTESGTGQGNIYVETGQKQALADAGAPATAGDTLTIYCTGLGAVTPQVTAGTAAPSDHLTYTANPVSVTIGGQPAKVIFSGLSPGFTGLYQINVTVPSGVPPSNQTPVVITVAGISSRVVTIAVK